MTFLIIFGVIKVNGKCTLCERAGTITAHHLIPKSVEYKFPKILCNNITPLCKKCHHGIHRSYSNTELASIYVRVGKLENLVITNKLCKRRRKIVTEYTNDKHRSKRNCIVKLVGRNIVYTYY